MVIPGSSNPDHIKENIDLFGFELTDEEMEQIGARIGMRSMIGTDEKYLMLCHKKPEGLWNRPPV